MEAARGILAAIPEGEFPFAARVAGEYAENPFDVEAAFEFGLELILDGLERSLERGTRIRRGPGTNSASGTRIL